MHVPDHVSIHDPRRPSTITFGLASSYRALAAYIDVMDNGRHRGQHWHTDIETGLTHFVRDVRRHALLTT